MRKRSVDKAKTKLIKARHKAKIRARRPAHKKLLMHPAMMLMVLIAGVLLGAWTFSASADSNVTVNGVIPAEPLTEPAVILKPKNNQHFNAKPITVSGSCPYKSYIKLYRNNIFSGTALCGSGGGFTLETDLSNGANVLLAHIFNVTDQEGPLSDAVTVYFDSPKSIVPSVQPLSLSSDYRYQGYSPNQAASWTVKVIGGVAPFAFNVKWGDGNESNYVAKDNSDLVISHSYAKAGSFNVKVSAADSANQTAFLQLTALVVNQHPSLITTGSTGSIGSPPSRNWLWLAWPSYLFVLMLILSFWLGEREEYYKMLHKQPRHRLRY
jgi:hypothetical protein